MAKEHLVFCWYCASEFDSSAAAWCSHSDSSKICPFCLRCFCDASEEYRKKFWDSCPDDLMADKLFFQNMAQEKLGELLVKSGKITPQQLRSALQEQQSSNLKLGEVLVAMKVITRNELQLLLLNQKRAEEIDLAAEEIDPTLIAKIGREACLQHQAIPIELQSFGDRQFLRLAVGSPEDLARVKKAPEFKPYSLIIYLAPKEAIRDYLSQPEDGEHSLDTTPHMKHADAIEYFNRLLKRAVISGFSDIFCEFKAGKLRIFYQDNDRLLPAEEPEAEEKEQFQIIKRIAGIDQQRRDETQKSVVQLTKNFAHIQVRVFYFPTSSQELIRLRVINLNNLRDGISERRWDSQEMEMIRQALSWSTGLYLVAGTNASRICETLYSIMYGLGGEVVASVETMVLARSERFFQIEKEEQEIDRSILDGLLIHSPHSLFLFDFFNKQYSPEFLDFVNAGKLFLGLQAFSYESLIERLTDEFEIPFEYVAQHLRLLLFERDVHILCPHCKHKDPQGLAHHLPQFVFSKEFTLYQEKGCSQCEGTGNIRSDAIGEVFILPDADRTRFTPKEVARIPRRISELGNLPISKKAMNLLLKGEVSYREYSRFF